MESKYTGAFQMSVNVHVKDKTDSVIHPAIDYYIRP
jgi:hypothetical protein